MMIRKRFVALLVAVLASFGLVGAATGPASAATFEGACYASGANHCYTVLRSNEFSPRATRINSNMNFQCLVKPGGFSGWSSVESMWGVIDPAANGGKEGFVETGIWNQQNFISFYWVRTGGTYGTGFQIYETNVVANANNSHAMRTQWNPGNNTFTIYNDGVLRGTLSSPKGPLSFGETGGEATTNSGSHNFDTWGLQRVQNAVTYASWPGGYARASWTSPPWSNPPATLSDSEIQARKIATGAQC